MAGRCSASNMAHIRQSRPEYGLDFQVKVLRAFRVVPSSLGSEGSYLGLIVSLNSRLESNKEEEEEEGTRGRR